MTAKEAHREWFTACTAANQMPPGPARDASMAEAMRLAEAWGEAVAAEAEAKRHAVFLPQGLFNPHSATPRA